MVYLGDTTRLFTTGFSKFSDRQYAVWSQNDLSKPLVTFFKMGQPWPLFHLLSSFQTHITIFSTNKCENVHPVHGAGIGTHDLFNMRLLA